MSFYGRETRWLEEAEALKPTLFKRRVEPFRLVRPERDAASFQGWRMAPASSLESAFAEPLPRSWEKVFDFGTHRVGRFSFALEGVVDCPQRINLLFGETPAEAGEGFSGYEGGLGKAWLQEESVVLDSLPAVVELPRRYAFRYVKLSAELNAPAGRSRLASVSCLEESSASWERVEPLDSRVDEALARVDAIALRTLANCMQEVYEDGPKRDRRLWLGDFRLQALVDYASFKNFALAKRCLLLFAALSGDDGMVPTCLFHKPSPHPALNTKIFDYVALFPVAVLEYAEASGDWALAKELWPVCERQAEIVFSEFGSDGLFMDKAKWWLFIDWNEALDRRCSEQAAGILCLKRCAALGKALALPEKSALFEARAAALSEAAGRSLFDSSRGVFTSGPSRQVSWASQAWMAVAGVVEGATAARALRGAMEDPSAPKPVSPYLNHYLVEAMTLCGMRREARARLLGYWGRMAELGADAFWEVFDPSDERLSPYGSHLMNSCCHAWSCTPSLFIRAGLLA